MHRRIMKCSKWKKIELKSYVINEIEVDQCPRYRGIWFNEQAMPAMLTHASKDLMSLSQGKECPGLDKRSWQCPVDDSDLMRVFRQPDRNVVLDRWPKCLGSGLMVESLSDLQSNFGLLVNFPWVIFSSGIHLKTYLINLLKLSLWILSSLALAK